MVILFNGVEYSGLANLVDSLSKGVIGNYKDPVFGRDDLDTSFSKVYYIVNDGIYGTKDDVCKTLHTSGSNKIFKHCRHIVRMGRKIYYLGRVAVKEKRVVVKREKSCIAYMGEVKLKGIVVDKDRYDDVKYYCYDRSRVSGVINRYGYRKGNSSLVNDICRVFDRLLDINFWKITFGCRNDWLDIKEMDLYYNNLDTLFYLNLTYIDGSMDYFCFEVDKIIDQFYTYDVIYNKYLNSKGVIKQNYKFMLMWNSNDFYIHSHRNEYFCCSHMSEYDVDK